MKKLNKHETENLLKEIESRKNTLKKYTPPKIRPVFLGGMKSKADETEFNFEVEEISIETARKKLDYLLVLKFAKSLKLALDKIGDDSKAVTIPAHVLTFGIESAKTVFKDQFPDHPLKVGKVWSDNGKTIVSYRFWNVK